MSVLKTVVYVIESSGYFRIFQTLTVKRRPKQLQKFHTMKEITIALVSKASFGLLENGLFVTNMYPAFSNGLKHDTFRTRYLVFVCLYVVVVVVVLCSNNPNLSCHLQVYLLH